MGFIPRPSASCGSADFPIAACSRFWEGSSQTSAYKNDIEDVVNTTLGRQETEASDAFINFVETLGLPTTLHEVGVTLPSVRSL